MTDWQEHVVEDVCSSLHFPSHQGIAAVNRDTKSNWAFQIGEKTGGTRVWLREKDQLYPCTVSSCTDGSLVLTSDYGEFLPMLRYHIRVSEQDGASLLGDIGQSEGGVGTQCFLFVRQGQQMGLVKWNKESELYFLSDPESYYYLSQSGCVKDKSLDDTQLFNSVMAALKVMEFSEEEIRDVFKLLSGVLQMGNIEFMMAGGAQITTKAGKEARSDFTASKIQAPVVYQAHTF
ncbi:UNVERIFIED_CONTAM: hypothetical protein FKN15_064510 [Acipenser sinensis]